MLKIWSYIAFVHALFYSYFIVYLNWLNISTKFHYEFLVLKFTIATKCVIDHCIKICEIWRYTALFNSVKRLCNTIFLFIWTASKTEYKPVEIWRNAERYMDILQC